MKANRIDAETNNRPNLPPTCSSAEIYALEYSPESSSKSLVAPAVSITRFGK
jgi:hypothetical protein